MTLTFLAFILGVSGYTKYVSPGIGKMKKDVLQLREEVAKMASKLVPLEGEELDLLSSRISGQSIKRRLTRTKKGYLVSIYEEPLVAFAVKKYLRHKSLYYVRTTETELVFIKRPKGVQVYLNGQPIGFMKKNQLFDIKGRNLLGEIVAQKALPTEIVVGERSLAQLNSPDEAVSVNPRVFNFLSEMNPSEKKILLAIAIYSILDDSKI